METSAPPRHHFSHPIAIALAALLLLAGAIGLVVWLSSGPSVYVSGHRWALYPSTGRVPGRVPESESSTEQEKLAFDGNVKLFSLLYTEHLTDEQGEHIREALCHVLIDLPPKGVLRITGGGGSDVDNFNEYTDARVIIQEKGEEPPLETKMRLRFRHSDRTLSILVDDTKFQVVTEPGNVFIVRIGNDGRINGQPIQTTERVRGQLEAVDVERLLGKAKPD